MSALLLFVAAAAGIPLVLLASPVRRLRDLTDHEARPAASNVYSTV